MSIPRPEYPRPQLVRPKWQNLNGQWKFEMDHGKSGRARKLYETDELSKEIIVPFCPESSLSGIGYTDFMACVWYCREFKRPENWDNGRVLLHFGAVDYHAEVWVNGKSAGRHRGGYVPFTLDITQLLTSEQNIITVCAEDDVRCKDQPRGKQSEEFYSSGCTYTRTTGIWQTVWVEYVPCSYIKSYKLVPDVDNSRALIDVKLSRWWDSGEVTARAFFDGKEVGNVSHKFAGETAKVVLDLTELHLWSMETPNLYDLEISCGDDCIKGYFGMRVISFKDNCMTINGKKVFQRLVLDQGFYPDGIYTAPSDEALKKDIELSKAVGFNGARLHEKTFEPRLLYHADKMGYIVWGEFGNWGLDISRPSGLESIMSEWMTQLERDFNHPSIVGWCPFNETQKNQISSTLQLIYDLTKAYDPTRPVIDTSGWTQVVEDVDIYDVHDYDQDPEAFKKRYETLPNNGEQPFFVSEYGGTWWNVDGDNSGWGYGKSPETLEAFYERYRGLTLSLLNNPQICAFCYTQLTDVEQEQNGIYTYDRRQKFDTGVLYEINTTPAAIEQD